MFRWNAFIAKQFENAAQGRAITDKWIIKMVHGYYEEMSVDLFANLLSIHIISRRMI